MLKNIQRWKNGKRKVIDILKGWSYYEVYQKAMQMMEWNRDATTV